MVDLHPRILVQANAQRVGFVDVFVATVDVVRKIGRRQDRRPRRAESRHVDRQVAHLRIFPDVEADPQAQPRHALERGEHRPHDGVGEPGVDRQGNLGALEA